MRHAYEMHVYKIHAYEIILVPIPHRRGESDNTMTSECQAAALIFLAAVTSSPLEKAAIFTDVNRMKEIVFNRS
jgi:hypothetical protein